MKRRHKKCCNLHKQEHTNFKNLQESSKINISKCLAKGETQEQLGGSGFRSFPLYEDPFAWMDMTFGIHIGPNCSESDMPTLWVRGAGCQPGAVCKCCGLCCGRSCHLDRCKGDLIRRSQFEGSNVHVAFAVCALQWSFFT